eukprot:CAMPEP_0167817652 /NCGR_PEP_ID=MMETSP0112_2-20121227/4329_1 /TAXON_ID=91324 /ORGANISM="Lotharella globosa, Strain CCCM811" /LENGTH=179 /DNA_ID=CAMNT_0007717471 /DNA_START=99 /DNA_END=640 /DNA_ORIENTATION=+
MADVKQSTVEALGPGRDVEMRWLRILLDITGQLASSDLQWLLVRKHNAFQVKKDGITFSCEPNNPANISSFKYSGLANTKALGLEMSSEEVKDKEIKTLLMTVKTADQQLEKVHLKAHEKSAGLTALKSKKIRPDVSKALMARYKKLRSATYSQADIEKIIAKIIKTKDKKVKFNKKRK